MSLFGSNWRTQVKNLLPHFKRSVSMIDYITSLINPVRVRSSEFETFEADIRKRSRFNGRMIVLTAALNNKFGITVDPKIQIDTNRNKGRTGFVYNSAEGIDPIYVYNEAENKPNYVFNSSEVGEDYNFTVKIPSGVYTAELDRRTKAEVKIFKLAGMKFKTETY